MLISIAIGIIFVGIFLTFLPSIKIFLDKLFQIPGLRLGLPLMCLSILVVYQWDFLSLGWLFVRYYFFKAIVNISTILPLKKAQLETSAFFMICGLTFLSIIGLALYHKRKPYAVIKAAPLMVFILWYTMILLWIG